MMTRQPVPCRLLSRCKQAVPIMTAAASTEATAHCSSGWHASVSACVTVITAAAPDSHRRQLSLPPSLHEIVHSQACFASSPLSEPSTRVVPGSRIEMPDSDCACLHGTAALSAGNLHKCSPRQCTKHTQTAEECGSAHNEANSVTSEPHTTF